MGLTEQSVLMDRLLAICRHPRRLPNRLLGGALYVSRMIVAGGARPLKAAPITPFESLPVTCVYAGRVSAADRRARLRRREDRAGRGRWSPATF